jgi:DNA topoisomerase-3
MAAKSIERLIIAEKSGQAARIAEFLARRTGAVVDAHIGFYVVGDDVVTYTNGHLFDDAKPEAYDSVLATRWADADHQKRLPFFPDRWIRTPRMDGRRETPQIAIIASLLKHSERVVHACDADREGQLIGDELLDHLGCNVPVERLPVLGFGFDALEAAFGSIKPNAEFAPLRDAAIARSRADWIYGINPTRVLTPKLEEAGYTKKAISAGRVVSATLCLLVERARAIDSFIATVYYELGVALDGRSGPLVAHWRPRSDAAYVDDHGRALLHAPAQNVRDRVRAAGSLLVHRVADEVKREAPPLPYSMSGIQSLMNARYGFTAADTYEAVERLYGRHFLISYPRGNNRYFRSDLHAAAPALLARIAQNLPSLQTAIGEADLGRRSPAFNTAEIKGAHGAIAPLDEPADLSALTEVERATYEEICKVFVAQFLEETQRVTRVFTLRLDLETFEARHSALVSAGWRIVHGPPKAQATDAPTYTAGESLRVVAAEVVDKQTTPPHHFTDGSLIAAMNAPHLHVSDPAVKALLGPSATIGRESTQTSKIKTLLDDGLIRREQKYLVPTALAYVVADALPPILRGPALTAVLERELDEIERGNATLDAFVRRQEPIVRQAVDELRAAALAPNKSWKPKRKATTPRAPIERTA